MRKIFLIFCFAVAAFRLSYAVNVEIDGANLEGAMLVDSVTYVPLRAFGDAFGGFDTEWNNETKTAKLISVETDLSARMGDMYIEANGRIVYSGKENILIEGKSYVPVRSIAKIFGADVLWDSTTMTAKLSKTDARFASADEYYNNADLYWLAKIIHAESEGEPLGGKIAVGNVVLNRVESEDFPNTVYDVIFDKKGGVQFTPVANGSIAKEPGAESVVAAKICLENYRMADEKILFFLNPVISTSTWVPENRDFVMTIGNHDFYA